MKEKWELCYLDLHSSTPFSTTTDVFILSPDGEKVTKNAEDYKKVICELLAEGWEPYAVQGIQHYFRRRIS